MIGKFFFYSDYCCWLPLSPSAYLRRGSLLFFYFGKHLRLWRIFNISLSIISKKATGVSCDNVVPYMFNSGCTGCAHNFVLNVPPTIQKHCSTTIRYVTTTILLQILCNSVLQCSCQYQSRLNKPWPRVVLENKIRVDQGLFQCPDKNERAVKWHFVSFGVGARKKHWTLELSNFS